MKDNVVAGLTQTHNPCGTTFTEVRPVIAGDCAAAYAELVDNIFMNVKELDFAMHPNGSSFWRVFGHQAVGRPADFVLTRKDAIGFFSPQLVTPGSVLDPTYDALLTPMTDFPAAGIIFSMPATAIEGAPSSYTFLPSVVRTPEARLQLAAAGGRVRLEANVIDALPSKVEFWVDDMKLGEVLSPPFALEVDMSTWQRVYAYFYAKATNSANKVGYSAPIEVGPMVTLLPR